MFDIGFSEIVLIAVVALVVLGPERLPKAARTLGHLFGRLQRYVNEVKADISREMELDELRKLKGEMQGAAREFEETITTTAKEAAEGVRGVERELNEAAGEAKSSAAAPAALPAASPAGAASSAAVAPFPAATESARQAALPGFEKI